MKKVLNTLGIILLAFSTGACTLDDEDVNFEFTNLQIVSVEVPESFNVHEIYPIKITYVRPNDCTYFQGFDVIKVNQTTRNVIVVGSMMTDEDCAEKAQEIETSFNFDVIYSEDYLFRFWTGNDDNGDPEFLEIEIPVN